MQPHGEARIPSVKADGCVKKAIKNNLKNGIAFQESKTILGVKISLKISEISEVYVSEI